MQRVIWAIAGSLLLSIAVLTLSEWHNMRTLPTSLSDAAFIKSPNEKRIYHSYFLSNGLQVLLIADPQTKKAAASIDLAVGSGDSPLDSLGLAHYLEHTLFLGTKKYPTVDNFQEFIREHGGSYNAYTSYENTNYFFDIQSQYLTDALDRFADFFVSPLFNRDFIERERNVVDSEYSMGLKEDGRRYYAILQEVLNPRHPITRFSVGNKDTLRGDTEELRKKLLTFYRAYYRPNLMRLVVYGKESLQELQGMVDARFGEISKAVRPPRDIKEPLFAPGQLPALLQLRPIKEKRYLDYYFPIEPQEKNFRSKPAYYIEHLLDYRGKGSLYRLLKDRGWANGFGAHLDMSFPEAALFNIAVELTPAGEKHIDEITRLVFQIVRLIEEQGVEEWRFKELQTRAAVKFKYKQKEDALSYVRSLSRRLQELPTERILSNSLWDEYAPQKIRSILKDINENNVLIVYLSPQAHQSRTEKYYQAGYDLGSLKPAEIKLYGTPIENAAISLPQPNQLISKDIEVINYEWNADQPQPLTFKDINAWYFFDDSFQSPKIDMRVVIESELSFETLRERLTAELLKSMMAEQLTKISHASNIAGYGAHIAHGHYGYKFSFTGYNKNFSLWMKQALAALTNYEYSEKDFDRVKRNTERNLKNSLKGSPTARLNDTLREVLVKHEWDESKLLQALTTLSLADVQQFARNYFKDVKALAFVGGNLPQADADALIGEFIQEFPARITPLAKIEIHDQLIRLNGRGPFLARTTGVHNDSAIQVLFQARDYDYATRVRTALVARILQPSFFQQLRTEQELGYRVSAYYQPMFQLPGISFVVQSNHKHSYILNERIEQFLRAAYTSLRDLPAEDFENYKEGIINQLREEPKRLGNLIDHSWDALFQGVLSFDDRERAAQAMEQVTQAELLEYYTDFFQPHNRISIFTDTVLEEEGSPPSGEWIKDYIRFKQNP